MAIHESTLTAVEESGVTQACKKRNDEIKAKYDQDKKSNPETPDPIYFTNTTYLEMLNKSMGRNWARDYRVDIVAEAIQSFATQDNNNRTLVLQALKLPYLINLPIDQQIAALIDFGSDSL